MTRPTDLRGPGLEAERQTGGGGLVLLASAAGRALAHTTRNRAQ